MRRRAPGRCNPQQTCVVRPRLFAEHEELPLAWSEGCSIRRATRLGREVHRGLQVNGALLGGESPSARGCASTLKIRKVWHRTPKLSGVVPESFVCNQRASAGHASAFGPNLSGSCGVVGSFVRHGSHVDQLHGQCWSMADRMTRAHAMC